VCPNWRMRRYKWIWYGSWIDFREFSQPQVGFTPDQYAWTEKSLLRDFVNANSASYYRWANKLICMFVGSLENG